MVLMDCSFTASSTVLRYTEYSSILECQELRRYQPDGYLAEKREAVEDDHGFSTFFSETGIFAYMLLER